MTADKYSAEYVRQLVEQKSASFLSNHDCSLCGIDVGYMFYPDGSVYYRSGCNCAWSPDQLTSYRDIADWLAMQDSDAVREQILARLK